MTAETKITVENLLPKEGVCCVSMTQPCPNLQIIFLQSVITLKKQRQNFYIRFFSCDIKPPGSRGTRTDIMIVSGVVVPAIGLFSFNQPFLVLAHTESNPAVKLAFYG